MPFVWMAFLFVYLAFHCHFMRTILHSKLLSPVLRAWSTLFALQDIFAGRSASAARDHLLFFNFWVIKTKNVTRTDFVCYLLSLQFRLSMNNMLYYSHSSLILSTVYSTSCKWTQVRWKSPVILTHFDICCGAGFSLLLLWVRNLLCFLFGCNLYYFSMVYSYSESYNILVVRKCLLIML